MTPLSTYRLQFHKGFPFQRATALAPYFESLGISHIYSSPILKARAGSVHCYDVIDHREINPELGGEAAFREMARTLRARGIGIILDIVPNHMAVGGRDNAWWLDVLERGRSSAYAAFFDIDWRAPGLADKVLAPFLDGTVEHCLESGDLRLIHDDALQKLAFAYFDHRFPVKPEDAARLRDADTGTVPLHELRRLLAEQHFALCGWHEADARINWRRFFDITALAALRTEHAPVFEATHGKIFALFREGLIDGLRVDHIDGLADPKAYCRCLRERLDALAGAGTKRPYLIVEKILAFDETMPPDWGIDGTTGYDFMNDVSALQHAPDPDNILGTFWRDVSRRPADFDDEERPARREILIQNFAAQSEGALLALNAAARSVRLSPIARENLASVIGELRCYRTYATGKADSPPPGPEFAAAANAARKTEPLQHEPVGALADILSSSSGDPPLIDAIRRFNQLTAPVAAKAVEDTAFYRHGRLLSRNDVGFDPRVETLSPGDFHGRMAVRAASFPLTMLTTATHDHKRGEDARTRLAVLSEISSEWIAFAGELLHEKPRDVDSGDACQLLQTLIGAWPPAGIADIDSFAERVSDWCRKFLREAKLRSSWNNPCCDYENRLAEFGTRLIADSDSRSKLNTFIARIAPAAIANSIVQIVLRCTVPGIPDLFQGRERWDFSMVDPDNRAEVDYRVRECSDPMQSLSNATIDWHDGSLKQALVAKLLRSRQRQSDLFLQGHYRAIPVTGPRRNHVLAFAREIPGARALIVVALRCADLLCGGERIAPSGEWWGPTVLDREFAGAYEDALTGITRDAGPGVSSFLNGQPACLLMTQS